MKYEIAVVSLFVFLALGLRAAEVNGEDRGTEQSPLELAQASWDNEADETFWLGRGMGRQLMTQEEWQEHRQKMQSLSPEERQRYREEWHKKMVEGVREQRITMPETAGPRRGYGPGSGMGSGGGMRGGSGGGMGPGGGMGDGLGGGGRR